MCILYLPYLYNLCFLYHFDLMAILLKTSDNKQKKNIQSSTDTSQTGIASTLNWPVYLDQ